MCIACDYTWCIYNQNNLCTSNDELHIDGNGTCSAICLPNIPQGVLQQYKHELLERYNVADTSSADIMHRTKKPPKEADTTPQRVP